MTSRQSTNRSSYRPQHRTTIYAVLVLTLPVLLLASYLLYVLYLRDVLAVCPPACVSADYSGGNLTEWDFAGVDLSEANLGRTQLREANFEGANLYFTNFQEAQMVPLVKTGKSMART